MATETKRQYFYSTGKRKTSVATVRMYEGGDGNVKVNGMDIAEYFAGVEIENAVSPLVIANLLKSFDLEVTVMGGGKSSQSDAMRHGITRGLVIYSPELRGDLKRAGYVRRDARIKERKKPGLRRARRAPQFSKR